jgi:hypothetical protein
MQLPFDSVLLVDRLDLTRELTVYPSTRFVEHVFQTDAMSALQSEQKVLNTSELRV